MNVQLSPADAISQLQRISDELEKLFCEISSLRSVFRHLLRGRDFEGQMRRAEVLESRVHALRSSCFSYVGPSSSRRLRPFKVYWCYIFLAASALAEITARDQDELLTGVRSTHGYRQESINRFGVAIDGAKKQWGRLSRHEVNARIV